MSGFKRATKAQSRLRMGLAGPAGSGKTYTALVIAAALAGERPVAVVDTERGSASKYADLCPFDVLELQTFHPQRYIDAIVEAGEAGYGVLVIDSLSHAWMGKDGALELVDRAAARDQSRNSFGAWREVTPIHNALVDALLGAPMDLIVTLRSKTEYVQERDERSGRTVVRKVGMAPVQRDGLEYEFDIYGELSHSNTLVVTKSRCPSLTGAVIERPGPAVAATLRAWLSDGAPAAAPPAQAAAPIAPTPAPAAASAPVARPSAPAPAAAPSAAAPVTGSTAGKPHSSAATTRFWVAAKKLEPSNERVHALLGVASIQELPDLDAALDKLRVLVASPAPAQQPLAQAAVSPASGVHDRTDPLLDEVARLRLAVREQAQRFALETHGGVPAEPGQRTTIHKAFREKLGVPDGEHDHLAHAFFGAFVDQLTNAQARALLTDAIVRDPRTKPLAGALMQLHRDELEQEATDPSYPF